MRTDGAVVDQIERWAELSLCETWRYVLGRRWGPDQDNHLIFVMVNPSKADATIDDPTVRKCMGFARVYGYAGIRVLNLFSYRETYVEEVAKQPEARLNGPGTEKWWHATVTPSSHVIVAWGSHAPLKKQIQKRVIDIQHWLPKQTYCLGTNADGSPSHPLMLSYGTELRRWK